MRTCLNSLNLGLSVRLFDILKTYYNGGTVVNELRRCVMTELYCLGQQNPNIKLNFYQQVRQVGLIDMPGQGLQNYLDVLIFEIIV